MHWTKAFFASILVLFVTSLKWSTRRHHDTEKKFVITFVGWLILQILSPEEWHRVIRPFLIVESTAIFLLIAFNKIVSRAKAPFNSF